jgi:hypothetical protein
MNLPGPCRTGIAVMALSLLAGCTPAPGPASGPSLVGAWKSQVQFTGGALASVKDLAFLYVFNAGGTMTESSNYDASPPVPPAYGEWRSTAAGRFQAKYTFFTSNPPTDSRAFASGAGWPPGGSGILTERVTLAADGRTYDSVITLELFDPAGKPVAGGGEGTAHGTRAGF